MRGIDPLLYRSYEVESQWKNRNSSIQKQQEDLKLQAIERNNSFEISSDSFSKVLEREKLIAHANSSPERKKLYEAAEQFEAYFVEQMFRTMKKNVQKSGFIDGGRGEEIFDDLLTTERVRKIAKQENFGLAEQIYQQLQRL